MSSFFSSNSASTRGSFSAALFEIFYTIIGFLRSNGVTPFSFINYLASKVIIYIGLSCHVLPIDDILMIPGNSYSNFVIIIWISE
jgi:hypothetical protein